MDTSSILNSVVIPRVRPHFSCTAAGGGTSPRVRRFFNPNYYRIVLLDQRGAGKSIPNVSDDYDAALYHNTTSHLVEDIEALREKLELDCWQLVLGGS